MSRKSTRDVGYLGETFIEKKLLGWGFQIIAKNFRFPGHTGAGEVDVMAFNKRQNTLLLCEVKTRRDHLFAGAAPILTKKQYFRILRSKGWIQEWLLTMSLPEEDVHLKLARLLTNFADSKTQVKVVVLKVNPEKTLVEVMLPNW
jgi:Holliday junction resolvase-like predicted endonuclease